MKIVVLTGAGISAESGLSTFRDSDGLWANYRIEEVCTPEALIRDREKVIQFYNMRRKESFSAAPNAAHFALKELEKQHHVQIITQNVDDLHERAGSLHILHLHGELRKLASSNDPQSWVLMDGCEQSLDARHPDGSFLRPYIVFFGEAVPMIEPAIEMVQSADLLVVIGTSLAVYPAASLVRYARKSVPIYLIDPNIPTVALPDNPIHTLSMAATQGVPLLVSRLLDNLSGFLPT